MLSVWSETYRLLAAMNASLPGRRWRLPAGARQELQAAIDLAPFLRAARARPLSDRVVASDASGSGGGVVYRDLPGADCARLATRREARGWRTTALTSGEDWDLERMEEGDYSLLDSGHWRTALSYRWRGQPNHINVKEAIAATQGVEWSCRTKACRGKRVVRLVDSSAVVGAFVRGRSSSYRLNQLVRRYCALSLAGDMQSHWVWVATDHNPADKASRRGAWIPDLTRCGDVHPNPGPEGARRPRDLALLEGTVNPVSTLPAYRRAAAVYVAWAPPGPVDPADAEAIFSPGCTPLSGLTYSQARQQWEAVQARMGIPGMFSFHSLRHGGATHDAIAGESPEAIQLRGRWASALSVTRYIGLHRSLLGRDIPPALWAQALGFDPAAFRRHFGGVEF
eukprot:jgi/Mesvir1/23631/Mv18306-RA.1